jgi:hypothetical protein
MTVALAGGPLGQARAQYQLPDDVFPPPAQTAAQLPATPQATEPGKEMVPQAPPGLAQAQAPVPAGQTSATDNGLPAIPAAPPVPGENLVPNPETQPATAGAASQAPTAAAAPAIAAPTTLPSALPADQPRLPDPAAVAPGHDDPAVKKASCSSCSGGLLGMPGPGPGLTGCAGGCCAGGQCVPGRTHCCSCCDSDSCIGRMLCGLYECICCPDPCYEPKWLAVANSAFFTDQVRPVTQTDLIYRSLLNMEDLDRSEFMFARFNVKQAPSGVGKGLPFDPSRADLNGFILYTEAAKGRFSIFFEMPYSTIESQGSIDTPNVINHSGFDDIIIGTKSMILDCELLQLTFQFKTFIPTASPGQGLGTGHTALEPALVFALKLTPTLYLQGETAYWFAIGGDAFFEGTVWHNHLSLNKILCHILPDVELIGTLEGSNWNFMNGAFTSPDLVDANGNPAVERANCSMLAAGAGARLNICNKVDFGVAFQNWFTSQRIANQEIRAEFRWRF